MPPPGQRADEPENPTPQKSLKPRLPLDVLNQARRLRRDQTDAERLLWSLLRDRRLGGFKFRRQHPVDEYILDFHCPAKGVAIELDGGQHDLDDQRARDAQRLQRLSQAGVRVLRFWNTDVLLNTQGVLEAIWDALHDDRPSP